MNLSLILAGVIVVLIGAVIWLSRRLGAARAELDAAKKAIESGVDGLQTDENVGRLDESALDDELRDGG